MRIIRLPILFLFIAVVFCRAVLAEGAATDAIVARVNNVSITLEQYQAMVEKIAKENRLPIQKAKSLPVLEDLIDLEILAQKAIDKGLDKQLDVRDDSQMSWRETLANAYVEHYKEANPLTQSQLAAVYEKQKDTLWPKEYKLRETVVGQESKAFRIAAEIDSIENFSLASRRYSISKSQNAGGFLGWVKLKDIPKEAQSSVAGLGEGAWLRKPIEISGLWHIYLVEKVRRPKMLPFAQVSESMRPYAEKQAAAKHAAELRNEAKVEIFPDALVGR
jgi:peptidyl-prolyl cis-trans isomerase C